MVTIERLLERILELDASDVTIYGKVVTVLRRL